MKVTVSVLILVACVVGVEGTGNQTCSSYFNKTICVDRYHNSLSSAPNDASSVSLNNFNKEDLDGRVEYIADGVCTSSSCNSSDDFQTCCQVSICQTFSGCYRGFKTSAYDPNSYKYLCPNNNCTSEFCCIPDSSSEFNPSLLHYDLNGTSLDVNTTFDIVAGMIMTAQIGTEFIEYTVTDATTSNSSGVTTVTFTPAFETKTVITNVWFSPAKAHHHKKKKTTKKETLTTNQRISVIIGAIAGTMVLVAIGYSFVTSGSLKKQSYTPLPSSSSSVI